MVGLSEVVGVAAPRHALIQKVPYVGPVMARSDDGAAASRRDAIATAITAKGRRRAARAGVILLGIAYLRAVAQLLPKAAGGFTAPQQVRALS